MIRLYLWTPGSWKNFNTKKTVAVDLNFSGPEMTEHPTVKARKQERAQWSSLSGSSNEGGRIKKRHILPTDMRIANQCLETNLLWRVVLQNSYLLPDLPCRRSCSALRCSGDYSRRYYPICWVRAKFACFVYTFPATPWWRTDTGGTSKERGGPPKRGWTAAYGCTKGPTAIIFCRTSSSGIFQTTTTLVSHCFERTVQQ